MPPQSKVRVFPLDPLCGLTRSLRHHLLWFNVLSVIVDIVPDHQRTRWAVISPGAEAHGGTEATCPGPRNTGVRLSAKHIVRMVRATRCRLRPSLGAPVGERVKEAAEAVLIKPVERLPAGPRQRDDRGVYLLAGRDDQHGPPIAPTGKPVGKAPQLLLELLAVVRALVEHYDAAVFQIVDPEPGRYGLVREAPLCGWTDNAGRRPGDCCCKKERYQAARGSGPLRGPPHPEAGRTGLAGGRTGGCQPLPARRR